MALQHENVAPEIVEVIEGFQDIPSFQFFDMHITKISKGRSTLEFTVRPEHLNTLGLCHGGVMATIADTAMGVAMRTTGPSGVTVEINVNFIRSTKVGDTMVAEGEVLHRGKKSIVCESRVYVKQTGKLCAVSRGTFLLVE